VRAPGTVLAILDSPVVQGSLMRSRRAGTASQSCATRNIGGHVRSMRTQSGAAHARAMGTVERIVSRGTRRGESALRRFGEDVRQARMEAAASQGVLGRKVRMSASKVSRAENGKLLSLTVIDASRIATAVGLDLVLKTYPGPRRLRDAAHADRLAHFLQHVGPPLRWQVEVPLPHTAGSLEQRAWDAMLFGSGETTAIELEMRLYDLQAQLRRMLLKERDGAPDHLLLIVADTRANRRIVREHAQLLATLPRVRTSSVLALLRAGAHPASGLVLF